MACIHVEGNVSLIESKKRQSLAVKKIVTTCVESSQEVNLCNFHLTELPEDVFLLIRSNKVKTFDVSENFLSILPIQVTTMTNLTTLNVSNNRLSALPRELVHCQQLTTVDISVNNFVQIPSVLLELKSISEINAKNNFITEVVDTFYFAHTNNGLLSNMPTYSTYSITACDHPVSEIISNAAIKCY